MKIFVTGGTGFIGRRLVDRLSKDKDNQIFCLTRDLSKAAMSTEENVQYIEGDLCDYKKIENQLRGIDLVYHLAAFLSYGNIDRKKMHEINVKGTENILRASKHNNIKKVVYVSSAGIYHPTKNQIVNENSPLSQKHTTHYTRSKSEGYEIAKKYIKQNSLNAVIVLPVSVYGNGSPLFESLISSVKGNQFQLIPTSKCNLSLVHVDDLCDGIILSMQNGKADNDYIFSGPVMSLEDITKKITSIFGNKVKVIKIPDFILSPVLYVKLIVDKFIIDTSKIFKGLSRYNKELYEFVSGNLVASDQKAKKELGWQPQILLDEGFKEMVLEQ